MAAFSSQAFAPTAFGAGAFDFSSQPPVVTAPLPYDTLVKVVPSYPYGHEVTPVAPDSRRKLRRWLDTEMLKL